MVNSKNEKETTKITKEDLEQFRTLFQKIQSKAFEITKVLNKMEPDEYDISALEDYIRVEHDGELEFMCNSFTEDPYYMCLPEHYLYDDDWLIEAKRIVKEKIEKAQKEKEEYEKRRLEEVEQRERAEYERLKQKFENKQ